MLEFFFHPVLPLFLAALLVFVVPAFLRRPLMLVGVLGGALTLLLLKLHFSDILQASGYDAHVGQIGLDFLRLDSLSFPFALVFLVAMFLNGVWGWHEKDRLHCVAGLVYPGAALGGVLAGDWVSFFVWWEIAALSSVFFVWGEGTRRAFNAAMRYLIIQVASGVLLLIGVAYLLEAGQESLFTAAGLRDAEGALTTGGVWILIALGIKSAFPLLHNWVQDSYPKATWGGTIILSVFTTKLAVYALARGFAGLDILIFLGAIMTIFPIFFALIENDLRRVLCYSINNQVGFMVIGIGLGTALSVNGAVGYAFCNIIFESLLFMSVGAVAYRTGTSKATELGGLARAMPVTMVLCLIGALSISAFPLFSGFVTKGLIVSAAGEAHLLWLWLVLLFASAGVLEHAGIKIPYFTFFAHESSKKPKEAPPAMLLAMGISAILTIAIGLFPQLLYAILPYPEALQSYNPYTAYHVAEQLQLLLFALLAFFALVLTGLYPAERRMENLDTDWFYRVPLKAFAHWAYTTAAALLSGCLRLVKKFYRYSEDMSRRFFGPQSYLARSNTTASFAFWVVLTLFGSVLVVTLISL